MTEWTAHCGCKITMDDGDGEPVEFVQRCAQHPAPATVTDVSGENRAMSLAKKALEDSGVDPETITSEVDPETRIGRARGPAGEIAEAPKLSLAEYLDAHPHAAERFAKKG